MLQIRPIYVKQFEINFSIQRQCQNSPGTDPDVGAIALFKLAKVNFFTMILYNSENNIRDKRSFCHPSIVFPQQF